MIKWLFEKIVGWPWCAHNWETVEVIPLMDDRKLVIGKNAYCKCAKCGVWKRFRLA